MGKRPNDCSVQVDQYCVEMDHPIKEMVIRRNSKLINRSIVAMALEDYSVSKAHEDRNISDLYIRLTDHPETL